MLHMLCSQICAPCRLSQKYYAKSGLNVTYVKFPGIALLWYENCALAHSHRRCRGV